MGEGTGISWATHTFNPWIGCQKVSPGCDHCYAERWDKRHGGRRWDPGAPRTLTKTWGDPIRWNKLAAASGERPWVFCASLADVFDNAVPPQWRVDLWRLIEATPHLRWMLLTKRIGNAVHMLPRDWPHAYPHAGLMATVVNQAEAERDVPKLIRTPAPWRGVSVGPQLGPVDLRNLRVADGRYLDALTCDYHDGRGQMIAGPPSWAGPIVFVICEGETGPGARPLHPDCPRSLRDQCAEAGVPFHFKQWGDWDADALLCTDARTGECPPPNRRVGKARAGRLLDGVEHNGMPS